jgi:prepilin-type N-terminal cleavage/methylation domain-containing protein
MVRRSQAERLDRVAESAYPRGLRAVIGIFFPMAGRRNGRNRPQGDKAELGFTLIELLIVIVVLGILTATVIFSLSGVTSKSANTACLSDAKSVQTAVAAFQTDNPGVTVTSVLLTGTADSGPFLYGWPSNPSHYFIGLAETSATASASEVDVAPASSTITAAPAVGNAAWVNFATETSTTGCNAVS